VLQRIAICYLICASLFLVLKVRGLIIAIVTLLAGYWLLMMLVPVPGCGPGHLEKDCNLEKYVDGIFLTGHMWSQTRVWDPEGLVSTIPAIATMLFGILTGYLMRVNGTPAEKTVWMFVTGNILLFAGLVMNLWLPINKSLWTSSYSVYMAGLASIVFALCYWIVDVREHNRWSRFFAIYGMNALAVFILTGVIGRLLGIVKIGEHSLEVWIFDNLFAPLASLINASLLYAIVNVFFYFLIVYIMYRRGWFLRV
jgi:predicted acyltransferase